MSDTEKTNKMWSPKPVEHGDSEAAKLCMVLHDCKQSVEDSLQQTIRTKKLKHGKFKGHDGNYVRLGPCFKPEKVDKVLKSLKDCFPTEFTKPPFLNEPEKLKCDWVKSSGKPVNGWTSTIDTRKWFNRLSSKHNKWRKMRIYEFLRLSTYPALPFYGALTLGLLCCWNPCLNVFVTGQGFKTITLEDIAFLTGLSPAGIDLPTQVLIDGALDMEKITPWKNKTNMSYSSIVDFYNPDKNKNLEADISRKEEVLFINLALCKLMMFPSCNVNKTFLKLAANIEASGHDQKGIKSLCLAPLFLGQVYRCLYRLRTHEKLSTAGGPIWVISMWGLFYFPRLVEHKDDEELKADFDKPAVLPVQECCCYGELAIHTNSPVVHLAFEEVLRGLLFPRQANQSDWHPFSGEDEMDISLEVKSREDTLGQCMKAATPIWLLEISCMMIREEDESHWSSILLPRDLICLEPQVIGIEVYNPNLVARQFGMTQGLGIPYYKTLNRPWGTRPNLLDMALKPADNKFAFTEKWLKSFPTYEVKTLHIIPWFRRAEIDPGYELWWIDFLKRCQPSWLEAFATLIRNIQGPLMVSSPSTGQAMNPRQNKQSRARFPVDPPQTKSSSQIEKNARTSTAKRELKRKSERIMAASTSRHSKKAVVEESKECDDNTPLRIFRRRHSTESTPSFQRSLRTIRKKRKYNYQPVVSRSSSIVLACSNKPKEINVKQNNISQTVGPDIYNVSLKVLKVLEKEVKEEATTSAIEQDTSHATQGIPECLTKIIAEEIGFETASSEPEDSLEPPHEMVRGLGSANLKETSSVLSMDLNKMALESQEANLNSISPQAEDRPSIEVEPAGGSGTRGATTSDNSLAIVVDGSSAFLEMEQPFSPQGLSYTPEKALAEVNSLVCLIEDTLRPAPIPSAFDVEKENAEKILNVLQSNMENLTAYADLANQINKLAVVSPPQFQPNLAHFRNIFLSLQDQLQDIYRDGARQTCNTDTLRTLSTAAKELRDRIQNSQERIDQIQAECNKYDKEIEELESKLLNLKQLRASKQQELALEQHKFADFSLSWSVTIPSLQMQANIMVTAQQTKAEWESTLKTVKANVNSFLELLRTM
ncbi:uncharacterized protein LOC110705450 isoform X1 [Chenopodium quinoa]|uniref:Aminotransferase-like plant mobile domain-containing protein n=1 Tax=Chenopodium quinoa TaxID=63459 RepID=A0A803LBB7_CHEQI|nr:uncharacterized protein LOC110705450 isoform X1 [Chenopodium quinoa]XP_021739012.1 uncharacterized protein LOC110705450 isoform X1 [Chenopodium quinoa]XP_021739013.1 uncharacterized protein LOC110705450 isoform X1 [Chenopodium quinoa]XP_021739014.1 uncharacterized protein LOC110705450 isoform X1 [Chenopodium quinoa]XP_021739015.1 uncharacterized protein LOC110705450 isoform X1 [Chenopodium quinoa]XP_021739016.1 uncharacterized protein LOC110705450 isoform X1 [Chenopodium quinoa]XP_02173901